jgi:hypothetical protein
MWIGLAFFVGGVVLTAGGLAASINGGFLIFWGAIVWGPIQMIRVGLRMKLANEALMDQTRFAISSGSKQRTTAVNDGGAK